MIYYEAQPSPAIDAPFDIEMVGDEIVFIGPGPVAFAMTWTAAHQTAQRLRNVLSAAGAVGGDGAPTA